MADEWIKMRTDLASDPAVVMIAEKLGIEEDTVVGKLHRLWSWADKHTVSGTLKHVTLASLNRIVCAQNFCELLIVAKWLRCDDDGSICIPNFTRHNGKSAKKRALGARRASRRRNAHSVTKSAPREEKRREEKNIREITNVISCPETQSASSVLTFPVDGKPGIWHLTQEQVDEWSQVYPNLDVLAECRKALAWVNANERKTARGMGRFLLRWIDRAQNTPRRQAMERTGKNQPKGIDFEALEREMAKGAEQ